MKLPTILITAALLGGCCSVTISKQGDRNLVAVRNDCLKLLNCIPIASGDPNYPNGEVCNWFENTATLKTNMQLLDDAMAKHGYRSFNDLTSYTSEESVVPILFKRYSYHTSAELLK